LTKLGVNDEGKGLQSLRADCEYLHANQVRGAHKTVE